MNSSVKYGLITAGFIILHKLIIYFTDQQLTTIGIYSNLLPFVFLLAGVFLGIKHKRNKELSGNIGYGQALKHGAGTGVVTAVLFALFTYVYFTYIDTGFLEKFIEKNREYMVQQKKTSKEIENTIRMIRENKSSAFQSSTQALLIITVSGIVSAFISATFLVKREVNKIS